MSKKDKLLAFLKVARFQARLKVADLAYLVQRDYGLSTPEARAAAQEIKKSARIAIARAQRELKAL